MPTKLIHISINDIQYKTTTPEEQDIGHFTRRNMKIPSMWDEWKQGERNKLNHMHDLWMFGKPIDHPNIEIVLRPH